jgi:intraflagellar transport protein 80
VQVDRVHYIIYVKGLPSEEARQAELTLFRRRPEEAESILLQAGLVYRAISLNLRLFNWDRYILDSEYQLGRI